MDQHVNSWVFGEDLGEEGANIIGEGFATRELAIAAAREYYAGPMHRRDAALPFTGEFLALVSAAIGAITPNVFHTAFLRWAIECPTCPFHARDGIENVADDAEWRDEAIEHWVDDAEQHSDSLDMKLDAVWEQWCKENDLHQHVYYLDDVRHHLVEEHAEPT